MVHMLSNADARRIFLDRHGLSDTPRGSGKSDGVASIVDHLGFVQLDSVNIFARAHDLILWSRRQQYRPASLNHALARDRHVFEHWTHDASAIDINLFPYWRLKFERDGAWIASRWTAEKRRDFMKKTEQVLRQVTDHGRCSSGDVGKGEKRGSGGWWEWHPSKTALEYLWRSGQLSVDHRDGFKKVYDLTERVIPAEKLTPRVSVADTIEWACCAALSRLGFATSGELAAFWAIVTPAEAKSWCAAALAEGRIVEINVMGHDGAPRLSFAFPELLDQTVPNLVPRVRILSPFDPALRDRKRAERLFNFHYRIELYVPAPKRVYGYYILPVMQGAQLIGRIDMKREGKTLVVRAFWPENGVKMGDGRIKAIRSELTRAARLGACDDVSYAQGWLRDHV